MKFRDILETLTNEILSDKIDYLALRNKLHDFKSVLLEITRLIIEDPSNKKDISFQNGIALNSSFAALCIDDIIRTRQYVRGVFKAVEQVQSKKKKPTRILYAGTGPFATLILPLLTKYKSNDLEFILLEVNETTSQYLKRLIKKLEIEDYIESVICKDASKYKINNPKKVDILISETMQYGLVKEQQVPIILNLLPQLNKDIIMIPNKIQLDLALMNTDANLILNGSQGLKYKKLKTILEFDKQFVYRHLNQTEPSNRFELCKQLSYKKEEDETYDKLAVLTSIHVFDNEWIGVDESSLTIPKRIFTLGGIDQEKKNISIDYVIKSNPDFEYELF